MLTFRVPGDRVEAWLRADAAVWTTFLEDQPGFVRKEVWRDDADESIQALIWWESLELWKAITMDDVDAIDERMTRAFGEVSPAPTMRSFTTLT